MLRLVHPAPGGQGTDPPKRRKCSRAPALSLTNDEVRHVRAALKNTARAYGGRDALAAVMGIPPDTITGAGSRRPSGTLVIRLARAAGVSVETILTGAVNLAGRCPACGHRAGDGRGAAGGAR